MLESVLLQLESLSRVRYEDVDVASTHILPVQLCSSSLRFFLVFKNHKCVACGLAVSSLVNDDIAFFDSEVAKKLSDLLLISRVRQSSDFNALVFGFLVYEVRETNDLARLALRRLLLVSLLSVNVALVCSWLFYLVVLSAKIGLLRILADVASMPIASA